MTIGISPVNRQHMNIFCVSSSYNLHQSWCFEYIFVDDICTLSGSKCVVQPFHGHDDKTWEA